MNIPTLEGNGFRITDNLLFGTTPPQSSSLKKTYCCVWERERELWFIHSQQGYVTFQNLCVTQTSKVWALQLNSSWTKSIQNDWNETDCTLWHGFNNPPPRKKRARSVFGPAIHCQSERLFAFFLFDLFRVCSHVLFFAINL